MTLVLARRVKGIGHLGQDRDGDFRRRDGADVKADRPVDSREFRRADTVGAEPLAALGVGPPAAQRADIDGICPDAPSTGLPAQLGLVGRAYDRGAAGGPGQCVRECSLPHSGQRPSGRPPPSEILGRHLRFDS